MTPIQYKTGDATYPQANGNKIIVHICNDIGGWGKGFVTAISRRLKQPEQQYREWYRSGIDFELGHVRLVQVEDDLWVTNLIGQHKIRENENGNAQIRYEAVAQGLEMVAGFASEKRASVHMPRIGCGLAGGSWDKIEPLIAFALSEKGIDTTVYDLQ